MNEQIKEMHALLDEFNANVPNYTSVCSIQRLKSDCVTFIRDASYAAFLIDASLGDIKNLTVIVQDSVAVPDITNVKFYFTPFADLLFTLVNNNINKSDFSTDRNIISSSALIDRGAVIGAEGVSSSDYKNEKVLFRHRGRVILEDNVYIGANAVIQRGRLDDTVIGRNTMISSLCVIGANTIVGENCSITIQAGVSGSAVIGNRVWLGIGAKVRNGISICDDAFIGMGSVVTKDVTKPGVYAGNPCRYIRPLTD